MLLVGKSKGRMERQKREGQREEARRRAFI